MKKIILERFKLMNIVLFSLFGILFFILNMNYRDWFLDAEINYIYKVFDGVYHPIMVSSKWLTGILGILLLFPSHIFRRWLFFVAPLPLLATYLLVQDISVYGGGVLYISRAQMAENGMIVLAALTALFVVGHLIYDFKFKKK